MVVCWDERANFSVDYLYAALVKWAEEEDRSVSNFVVRLVAEAIEEKESKLSRLRSFDADRAN
ncbi:hypothetical protein [Chamaesiphon sp. GL140_3_metabinner_50]|uniref:ribbon-helix-helix domain-containing protein n=1 Tax=Chamaesiphon sp. GL140_3_metabinner_50 TaxID=2970812 RepID=UPI0025CDFD6B|nr:hypothetical protein [Chamaesiphon sp. GL140_3_metabinner_50]